MALLWKTLFLMLLIATLLFLAWILYYPKPAPRSQEEALSRMIALERDGRYDDAVKTVQGWSQDGRREVWRDELLYQQIAMVYAIKAYKQPETREDSVRQGESNLEKSLSLFDREQSQGIGTELFGIGGRYEALGDLPVAEKCKFYAKAQQIYDRQLPLIQGDTYTAYGKTFSLKPLQVDVKKHLDAVRQKLSSAGCSTNGSDLK